MRSNLNGGGYCFKFFDAVDAESGAHLPFKSAFYCKSKALLLKGRELSEGEIACWASHFLLWKKCVELNQPIVVLEDDIETDSEPFQSALKKISESKYEYVRLMAFGKRKANARRLDEDFIEFLGNPSGAQGYWLTPRAAKKFIRHAKPWYFSQDDYMDSYFIHGVRNVCIFPFAVRCGKEQKKSTIENPKNHKKRKIFFFKLSSEIFRAFQSLRKAFYIAFDPHYAELKRLPRFDF